MSRKGKGVTFNAKDDYEMKLYAHAMKQGIFARYVKRLIQRDMESGETTPVTHVSIPEQTSRLEGIANSFL